MRFAGVESPEAADLLKGAEIIVGREYAAPLNKGEYYIEDLKGLKLVSAKGEILGLISDLVEGGGGYLAEVKLHSANAAACAEASANEKRFVPFRKEFFGDIEIEAGKIVLLEPWILE